MYNKMMNDKEINVKVGDRVSVMGNRGIVTEVIHGVDKEWNGKEYAVVPNSEFTNVRVNFVGELARWGQYQGGTYGGYIVID